MNLSCSIHVPCSIFSALIGMTRCFHQVVFAEPGAAQYRVCCLESTVAGVVRRADVRLRTVGRGELLCSPSIGSHEAVEAKKLHEAPVLPSIALGGVLECLQSVSSVSECLHEESRPLPRDRGLGTSTGCHWTQLDRNARFAFRRFAAPKQTHQTWVMIPT